MKEPRNELRPRPNQVYLSPEELHVTSEGMQLSGLMKAYCEKSIIESGSSLIWVGLSKTTVDPRTIES